MTWEDVGTDKITNKEGKLVEYLQVIVNSAVLPDLVKNTTWLSIVAELLCQQKKDQY